jgi:hypothetical protein
MCRGAEGYSGRLRCFNYVHLQIGNRYKQLIVTKADKGNTLVILRKEDYAKKIEEFIMQNNFTKLLHDITN